MVFQLIRWVDLSRSLSTWEDTEEHDAPPCPNRQVPPFATNSSQGSKIAPTPRSAACKNPGVDSKSLHKNLFSRNWEEGRERKLDGAAKKEGGLCVCMCAFCLPAAISTSEFQGAGRQAEAKVFTIMSATHLLLTCKEAIHETNQKKRSF
jgi:hypothetical protein